MEDSIQATESDWWKWGDPAKRKKLTQYQKLKTHFETRFTTSFDNINNTPAYKIAVDSSDEVVQLFSRHLPSIEIKTTIDARLKKATGKSYPDLLSAFYHSNIHLPDAVICPSSPSEVQQVIAWASEHRIVVVPFGGGSNVVGAFAQKEKTTKHVVLDLSALNSVVSIDEVNHTAVFEAGIYGPELEQHLNKKGFTLGHFPQSFEYSTLGGWIVTRSAGQESSYYGRIEDIVIALKVVTPQGEISAGAYEGDAEGVNIKSLFFGSEGTFGIVVEAKVRIHPLPQSKKWVTAVFPSFENGTHALRELIHAGLYPSVVRYSDEQETFFLSQLSHEAPSVFSKLKSYFTQMVLKFKGIEKPSLMMLRFDGAPDEAVQRSASASTVIKKYSGLLSGESLGKKWELSRFGLPYLRDDLLERGIFVDTMETVLPWNKIGAMKADLQLKLKQLPAFGNEKGILLAHLSHVYTASSSIYFTVITRQDSVQPLAQWQAIKTVVTDTIVAHGGAVSHHHSIGRDHQKWYVQQTDTLTREVLKAIKHTLDPNTILNPGKLFDE